MESIAVYSKNHMKLKKKRGEGTQNVRSLATIWGGGTRPDDLVTLISLKIMGVIDTQTTKLSHNMRKNFWEELIACFPLI
jgi:hypothetical protein